MTPHVRRLIFAAGLALIMSVAVTWPMASRLGTASRVDSGDGRHGVWNVAWVAHALTTAPTTLFDANIFYPHPRALAFSEANIVAGVMAIPAWLITGGNPIAAYNSVVILAFALAALSAFFLARTVGASRDAAIVAALIYGYCPYMLAHLPHIQLLMTFGPALSLATMHRFVAVPSTARAMAMGLALAVTGLACGYYGIFSALVVTPGILWFSLEGRRWRHVRYWRGAALAAAIVAAVIAPFFLPYLDVRQAGFGRSLEEARLYSSVGPAYLASAVVVHRWMLPLLGSWREVLFPGFQAVILGIAAIALTVKYGRAFGPRRIIAYYACVIISAVWISLGPDAGLYTLLYHTLPAFSFLRAPARIGVLVTLGLAILAAFTLTWIQARLGDRWRRVATLAILIAAVESWMGPLNLVPPPALPQAHRRLAVMPRGPVAEFPFFRGPADRHRHTEYMLLSTYHWQPLINGYSDFMPEDFFEVKPALETFPSAEALAALQEREVRWVVVHFHKYTAGQRLALRDALSHLPDRLRLVVDDGRVALYELIAPRRPVVIQRPPVR